MYNPLQRVTNTFRSDYELVFECRNCGTPAEPEAQSCSCCGRESIARYEI